jgi:hypothetical protein
MDKLPVSPTAKLDVSPTAAKKPSTASSGLIIGAFIVLAVIVVMLAEIDITDFSTLPKLGANFFVLLFCNYGMYLNQRDNGIGAGKQSSIYLDIMSKYDELKCKIVEAEIDYRMNEFCAWYIANELKHARQSLLAVSGISYATYEAYIGVDDDMVEADEKLTKRQKNAIIEANSLKPIYLDADMIMRRASAAKRKASRKLTPESKLYIKSGTRLVRMFISSALIVAVSFEVIINPSLATLAATALKVLFVVLNGFTGYKEGFANITVDSVDYVGEQITYLERFIVWDKKNPVATEFISQKISQNEINCDKIQ